MNSLYALDNGLVLHRDIFEPKGLLYPWLFHAIQISIPLEISVALYARAIQYFIVGVTALVSWSILKRYGTRFRLWIPCFWIVGNQYWTLNESKFNRVFFLEPNYLVVLLILIIMRCSMTVFESKNKDIIKRGLVIIAFAMAALPWVRIQGLLVTTVLFPLYICLCKRVAIITKPILTFIFTLACPFLYLYLNDASDEWYEQIIAIPLKYSSQGSTHSTMSNGALLTTVITFIISTLLISFITFTIGIIHLKSNIYLALLSTFGVIFLVYMIAFSSEVDSTQNNSPRNWIAILSDYFPQLPSRASLTCVAILGITQAIGFLRKAKERSSISIESKITFSFVFLSCLCGVYLYPNIGHTFVMSLPALITLSIILLDLRVKAKSTIYHVILNGTQYLFRSLSICLALIFVLYGNNSKFPFTNGTLAGVYADSKTKIRTMNTFEKLYERVGQRSTLILCDGVIVFNAEEEFVSNSPYFWSGDNIQFINLMKYNPDYAIICTESSSADYVSSEVASLGLNFKDWKVKSVNYLTSKSYAILLSRNRT